MDVQPPCSDRQKVLLTPVVDEIVDLGKAHLKDPTAPLKIIFNDQLLLAVGAVDGDANFRASLASRKSST